jgi:hypothetical protein
MQVARPAVAVDPRQFGRGLARDLEPARSPASGISADFKLFATTFLCGFIFVSILIS